MLHTVVYSSKSYYTNSGFSDVNRVHSRIPIITSVVVIYADQTAIPKVFAATFFASANFADILIGLPHLITSNCAVLAVLVLTADLHRAAKLLPIGPAITRQRESLCIGSIECRATIHLVDSLVAPLDIQSTA